MLLKNKRGHRSIFLRSDISLNEGRFVTSLFSHAEENFPKNCKWVYNLLPFKTVIFALSLPIHFCGNFKIHQRASNIVSTQQLLKIEIISMMYHQYTKQKKPIRKLFRSIRPRTIPFRILRQSPGHNQYFFNLCTKVLID